MSQYASMISDPQRSGPLQTGGPVFLGESLLPVNAVLMEFPLLGGPGPDGRAGALLRGAIGRNLGDADSARLLPHDGSAADWWLRTESGAVGCLRVLLSVCGQHGTSMPLLLKALTRTTRLSHPSGVPVQLGPPRVQHLEPIPDLLGRGRDMAPAAGILLGVSPLVLTRDGLPLVAREIRSSDLVVAACKRLAQLAGLPRPRGFAPPDDLPLSAHSTAFPWKGRRMPAAMIEFNLQLLPEPWRSLLIAGAMANLGRFAGIGGGAFVFARAGA